MGRQQTRDWLHDGEDILRVIVGSFLQLASIPAANFIQGSAKAI